MNYLFSPTTLSFYPKDLIKSYRDSNSLPEDVFVVDDYVFSTYGLSTPPVNKTRGFVDGNICWVDVEISKEQLSVIECAWVENELIRARDQLEKVQDADPRAVGTVSQWREYRKALRAWPEHPDFPNKDKRPTAPDAQ